MQPVGLLQAPELQSLILRAPRASLLELLNSTSRLQSLKLHRTCPAPDLAIRHANGWLSVQHLNCQPAILPACYSLFNSMKLNLKSLVLRFPTGIRGQDLSHLLHYLPELETASFSIAEEAEVSSDEDLDDPNYNAKLLNLKRLMLLLPADRTIKLTGLTFPALNYLALTSNISLDAFESSADQLQELEMTGVNSRFHHSLWWNSKLQHRLKKLSLVSNARTIEHDFNSLAYLKQLRSLSICFSDLEVKSHAISFAKLSPKLLPVLENLELANTHRSSFGPVEVLPESLEPLFSSMPQLRRVNFAGDDLGRADLTECQVMFPTLAFNRLMRTPIYGLSVAVKG